MPRGTLLIFYCGQQVDGFTEVKRLVGFAKTSMDNLSSTHLILRSVNSKPFSWSAICLVNLVFPASSTLSR